MERRDLGKRVGGRERRKGQKTGEEGISTREKKGRDENDTRRRKMKRMEEDR